MSSSNVSVAWTRQQYTQIELPVCKPKREYAKLFNAKAGYSRLACVSNTAEELQSTTMACNTATNGLTRSSHMNKSCFTISLYCGYLFTAQFSG